MRGVWARRFVSARGPLPEVPWKPPVRQESASTLTFNTPPDFHQHSSASEVAPTPPRSTIDKYGPSDLGVHGSQDTSGYAGCT